MKLTLILFVTLCIAIGVQAVCKCECGDDPNKFKIDAQLEGEGQYDELQLESAAQSDDYAYDSAEDAGQPGKSTVGSDSAEHAGQPGKSAVRPDSAEHPGQPGKPAMRYGADEEMQKICHPPPEAVGNQSAYLCVSTITAWWYDFQESSCRQMSLRVPACHVDQTRLLTQSKCMALCH